MTAPSRSVADLAVGESACVERLTGQGDVRQRLLEMGLTAGARVQLVRIAPLGDPIELKVRGYRLSVRKCEAASVIIGAA